MGRFRSDLRKSRPPVSRRANDGTRRQGMDRIIRQRSSICSKAFGKTFLIIWIKAGVSCINIAVRPPDTVRRFFLFIKEMGKSCLTTGGMWKCVITYKIAGRNHNEHEKGVNRIYSGRRTLLIFSRRHRFLIRRRMP